MNDDTTECWLKKLLEKKFRLPIKHHGHERIAGWMDGWILRIVGWWNGGRHE